jgi:hypothetical protein
VYPPNIPNNVNLSPVSWFDASHAANPIEAFRHAVAPNLNTYSDASRAGKAISTAFGKIGSSSPMLGRLGVGRIDAIDEPTKVQGMYGGLSFHANTGPLTYDSDGRITHWGVTTQDSDAGMREAAISSELNAQLSGATHFGVVQIDRDAFARHKKAGLDHQAALAAATTNVQHFAVGSTGALDQSIGQLNMLASASQQANGLSGQNGFAWRVDGTVKSVSQSDQARTLHAQIQNIGSFLQSDTQAHGIFGMPHMPIRLGDVQQGMTSQNFQQATYTAPGWNSAGARAVQSLFPAQNAPAPMSPPPPPPPPPVSTTPQPPPPPRRRAAAAPGGVPGMSLVSMNGALATTPQGQAFASSVRDSMSGFGSDNALGSGYVEPDPRQLIAGYPALPPGPLGLPSKGVSTLQEEMLSMTGDMSGSSGGRGPGWWRGFNSGDSMIEVDPAASVRVTSTGIPTSTILPRYTGPGPGGSGSGGSGGSGGPRGLLGPGPSGPGAGGGASGKPFNSGDYSAHLDALGEALQRLDKISENAAKSTGRLGEEQSAYVHKVDGLVRVLNGAVSQAAGSTDPGAADFVRRANGIGLDRANDMLRGNGQPGSSGLLDRAFVDSFRTNPHPVVPTDFQAKLQPFMMGGAGGKRSREDAIADGWYGDPDGMNAKAWQAFGGAMSVGNRVATGYRMFHNISNELVQPLADAAGKYQQYQMGVVSQLAGSGVTSGADMLAQPESQAAMRMSAAREQFQVGLGETASRAWSGLVTSAYGGNNGRGTLAQISAIGGPAAAVGYGTMYATENVPLALAAAGATATAGLVGYAANAGSDFSYQAQINRSTKRSGALATTIGDFGGSLGRAFDVGRDALDSLRDGSDFVQKRLQKNAQYEAFNGMTDALRSGNVDKAVGLANANGMGGDVLSYDPAHPDKARFSGRMVSNAMTGFLDDHKSALGFAAPDLQAKAYSDIVGMYGMTMNDSNMAFAMQQQLNAEVLGIDPTQAAQASMTQQGLNPLNRKSEAYRNAYSRSSSLAQTDLESARYEQAYAQILGPIQQRQNSVGQKAIDHTAVAGWAKDAQTADQMLAVNQYVDVMDMVSKNGTRSEVFDDSNAGLSYFGYLYGMTGKKDSAADYQRALERGGTNASITDQISVGRNMGLGLANQYATEIQRNLPRSATNEEYQRVAGYLNQSGIVSVQNAGQAGLTAQNVHMLNQAGVDYESSAQASAISKGLNTNDGTAMAKERISKISDLVSDVITSGVEKAKQHVQEGSYAAQYSLAAAQGGGGRVGRQMFEGIRDENARGRIEARSLQAQMDIAGHSEMGQIAHFADLAFAGNTDADLLSGNQLMLRSRQAESVSAGWGGYRGNNASDNRSALARYATSGVSQDDFEFGLNVLRGDPIANSQYVDMTGQDQYRRMVQTQSRGGSLGMRAGYDEQITSGVAATRMGRSKSQGYVRGDGAYSAAQLSGMNEQQINKAMNDEGIRVRNYDFNLANVQLNRQQAATYAGWGFEDRGIGLQRQEQDWGFGQQQKQLDLQKSQMQYNLGYQQQSMQIQRSHQVQEAQWGLQDMDFQRNRSEVSFGYSMIDADESIRYSTGRQRRTAMRHRDEAVTMHSMDMGHMDTEEQRAKTRMKWADEEFKRQQDNFSKSKEFEERNFQLQQDNHNKQIEFSREERKLDDERRTYSRRIAVEEMNEARESLAVHQASRKTMDDLAGAIRTANELYNENSAKLAYISTTGQGAADTLGRIADKLAQLAGMQMPASTGGTSGGATVTPSSSGSSLVAGADGMWHEISHYSSATIAQQPMGITSIKHPDGTVSYKGFAKGGYTGPGGKNEVAGSVHKGEYVIPQEGAPVLVSPEQIALLRQIVALLTTIQRDGGNAIFMVDQKNPQKTLDKFANLADKAWSQ